ncbi:hypothetical protein [Pedobacter agri]|nr:hypothetical protein [Pedobacter agri]
MQHLKKKKTLGYANYGFKGSFGIMVINESWTMLMIDVGRKYKRRPNLM